MFVLAATPARADELLGRDRIVLAATSAEQFALMGGVFLILGGAFVFAPQIISGVNGFFARLFGRPVKPRNVPAPQPATHEIHPPAPPGAEEAPQASDDHSQWEPEPEPEPEPPAGKAVSRLRKEISSAWGRQDDA